MAKKEYVGVRLPSDLVQYYRGLCERYGTTLTDEIIFALRAQAMGGRYMVAAAKLAAQAVAGQGGDAEAVLQRVLDGGRNA